MTKIQSHVAMQLSKVTNDEKNNLLKKEYLIYFDVCFRMATTVNADTPELAVDKIYDIPERELLNFSERDAPEIDICNVF